MAGKAATGKPVEPMLDGTVEDVDAVTGEIVEAPDITPARAITSHPRGRERLTSTRENDTGLTALIASQDDAGANPALEGHKAIISQILSAESPEEVLTPAETVQARQIVGRPFAMVGWKVQESEFDVGSPLYLVINAIPLPDGEPTVITCGHQSVMAQALRLAELDEIRRSKAAGEAAQLPIGREYWFDEPSVMEFVESVKANRYGSKMLRLRTPVEKR